MLVVVLLLWRSPGVEVFISLAKLFLSVCVVQGGYSPEHNTPETCPCGPQSGRVCRGLEALKQSRRGVSCKGSSTCESLLFSGHHS